MKKSEALEAVIKARELSKKRNFLQTFEMMVNFTGMDMKKPDSLITARVAMPHSTGQASGKVLVFAKTEEFADSLKEKVEKITNKVYTQLQERFDKDGIIIFEPFYSFIQKKGIFWNKHILIKIEKNQELLSLNK